MKNPILFLFLAVLCFGCKTVEEKKLESKNFELLKLSDGVFSCIHKFGGKAICNSGIVDNGNETIIFDAFLSPDVSKELIDIVQELDLSPIKYVINSHGHNDHIRGNQSFDTNVDIIATKKTKAKIENEEPESIMAEKEYAAVQYQYFNSEMNKYDGDTSSREYMVMKMMKPYFEELSLSYKKIETRLPNILIEKRKELNGKTRDVLLLEFDSCHSVSDLVMYLPKEKILFTGDIVFNEFHPYLADGNSSQLKHSLNELKKMEIDIIVPGHGNIGGKELLSVMIKYIEDLEGEVEKLIDENVSLDELKSRDILYPYRDWWLGNFYPVNLEYLYHKKINE